MEKRAGGTLGFCQEFPAGLGPHHVRNSPGSIPPVCVCKTSDDSNTPCPPPRDAVQLLGGMGNGAQDAATAGSAGSRAAQSGLGSGRPLPAPGRRVNARPPTSSVQRGEHPCGLRGSLTWPGARGRSRYCSNLRKPGPPHRSGAWPVQGKGSERAEGTPAYIATPGSRTAASATAQNIATVPGRCSSPGPPWSPAEEL